MATEAPPAVPLAELATPSVKPQEISFTLPKALHTTAHVHLNFLGHCAMVFLATSSPGDSGGSIKPMGSFVYAMPDVSTLSAKFGILCHITQCNFLVPYYMDKGWHGCLAQIWNTSFFPVQLETDFPNLMIGISLLFSNKSICGMEHG